MELAQVVASAQQGDKQAFYSLYQQFVPRVYAICWRLLAHKQKAEDASQEVFIKVFESVHQFKGESAFSTWLYRIVTNLCTDRLRGANRRRAGRRARGQSRWPGAAAPRPGRVRQP